MRVNANNFHQEDTGQHEVSGLHQVRSSVQSSEPYPTSRQSRNTTRSRRIGAPASSALPGPWGTEEGPLRPPPLMHKTSSGTSTGSSRSVTVDLGMLSREEFALIEDEYITSLDKRKQAKALISQKMFDKIWLVLTKPGDSTIETPQFRWWVRKMFALAYPSDLQDEELMLSGLETLPPRGGYLRSLGQSSMEVFDEDDILPVVIHDGKRLAVREHIYDILCVCHERAKHGGRDKTATEVRRVYTWVPKDLIALFVKHCPTCICKRTGKFDELLGGGTTTHIPVKLPVAKFSGPLQRDFGLGKTVTRNSAPTKLAAQHVDIPLNNLIMDRRPSPGPLLHGYPLGLDEYFRAPGLEACAPYDTRSRPDMRDYSQAPLWRFPSSEVDAGYHHTGGHVLSQQQFVKLPSIHRPADAYEQSPGQVMHPPKVTLPSLSEVVSGALTACGNPRPRSVPRQPLQAIPPNVGQGPGPGSFVPLQMPHVRMGPHMQAFAGVPSDADMRRIDPVLLQDEMRMLGYPEEMHRGREALGQVVGRPELRM